jgi:subtilisin family serine protease
MSAVRGLGAVTAGLLLGLVVAMPAQADGVRNQQWYLSSMDLAAVHAISKGSGVTVAVIDSGVDATHPDLAGNVQTGTDTSGTRDSDGRGTALASLVAGHGHGANNTDGILGVAPAAQILPIAFAPRAGEIGDSTALAAGIDTAVSKGAKVICIGRGVAPSVRLREAVEGALASDVAVVAADGDVAGGVFSPWPSSIVGVLTSIGLDRTGSVLVVAASRQTTGIGVPGIDMISATSGGTYRVQTGATGVGLLCGAVALVRAHFPAFSADQAVNLLRSTATDKGTKGPDSTYGAGVLNLKAALSVRVPSASPPSAVKSPPAPGGVQNGDSTGHKAAGVPLTDSRDWRRWLVVLPLIGFVVALGAFAMRRA